MEERLGAILDELGLPYQTQFEVAPRTLPARCKSRYHCGYQRTEDSMLEEDLPECEWENHEGEEDCAWRLPEMTVARYRLDFALDIEGQMVNLECDGFEYHGRTPQQIDRDMERDT